MVIQVDSREKARAIQKIIAEFDNRGIKWFVSKLPVGDYQSLDNPRLVIDRKQNLLELCGNVCQQHKRFKAELERANEYGIKLIVLCEHGRGIKSLQDVMAWENPRLKESPLAVSGERLFRILTAMSSKYGVEFLFCTKQETGKRIVEILSGQEAKT
jgi:ERCC4-type nuclease